ncbi:hypothetical protein M413DRAFT_238271 [Hebeloma cylindrosporum]|uniref:Uncharacterized protein n=1 Tax=Hebeloma cylindrosporum TaxID=76867 RepID=A0A0C3BQA5_HEBCY|nr:hypothetical protein M413DRAFT_238271 [Hebeloma cylindrosporum h7]
MSFQGGESLTNLTSFLALFRFYLAFIHYAIQILEKFSAVCSFTFLFLDIEGSSDSNFGRVFSSGSTTCPKILKRRRVGRHISSSPKSASCSRTIRQGKESTGFFFKI